MPIWCLPKVHFYNISNYTLTDTDFATQKWLSIKFTYSIYCILTRTAFRSKLRDTKMVIKYLVYYNVTTYLTQPIYWHLPNYTTQKPSLISARSSKSYHPKSHGTKTPLYDPGIGILIFYLNFFLYLL